MKIVKIKKSGGKSLYASFLKMTLIPLCVFGIIVTTFVSYVVRTNIQDEVHKNLSDIAHTVKFAYDEKYSGNYNIALVSKKNIQLFKGDTLISDNSEFIDNIKSYSGVDISIFFSDTRMLTTLGGEYVKTGAADKVLKEVEEAGTDRFYNNVKIGNMPYYAYYMPLFTIEDNTCIGMIGVAMPASVVKKDVNRSMLQCMVILVIFMIITAFIIVRFSSVIMDTIQRILNFLKELTNDNLNAQLDEIVLSRGDELMEIGSASVKLRQALKKLIERDALTGLYNRRAAEKKMDDFEREGTKFSVTIGDIDFFKKFNDNFGHECGDAVLREVAALLDMGMRGKGFAARWGGEEFLLIFENTDEQTAAQYVWQILESIRANRVIYEDGEHAVTMTFGVSERHEGDTIGDQIRHADDKLYTGKENGRNQVVV